MKVQHVAIYPSKLALDAGRFALTPELLAASGARYSRNNEGIESIVSKIDFSNTDKSVDGIFKMVDYGHASIADMAPVAMFMDDISIYLAYYLWANAPTAGGQESSTRYLKYSNSACLTKKDIEYEGDIDLDKFYKDAFEHYEKALGIWEEIAIKFPNLLNIPLAIQVDKSELGQKKLSRMQRNFAFDRARVYLPIAGKTNVMMINSARSWVELISLLLSSSHSEFNLLGEKLKTELALVTPRLTKHAVQKTETTNVLNDEFLALQQYIDTPGENDTAHDGAFLRLYNAPSAGLDSASTHRTNRYSYFGDAPKLTSVIFGWDKIAMAEVRDLNRHRTGSKKLIAIPNGFYDASDQAPNNLLLEKLTELGKFGVMAKDQALKLLKEGSTSYMYFTLLGHTYHFEHLTTLDKYIYEAELRTGVGAHYRYAGHLRHTLEILYKIRPELKGVIFEGRGEPE